MGGKRKRPGIKKELSAEKELAKGTNTDPDFVAGENFVEEPTGSATMVNLDGRWDLGHRR